MFGNLKCEEKQNTICKKKQFLEKIGIIVSPTTANLPINNSLQTEIINLLYSQFFGIGKTKRIVDNLRDEINYLFNRHNISLPITIIGISHNKTLKEIKSNNDLNPNNGLEFIANSPSSENEFGIIIGENPDIIEIGIHRDNNYFYFNTTGNEKIMQIFDSSNYCIEIFNKKTYIRESIKGKKRLSITITVFSYDITFEQNFAEISTELKKSEFDFLKIYRILKNYDFQNSKISKNIISIEYNDSDINIKKKVKISKGKLSEVEIVNDDYDFSFNEKSGWKIVNKNLISDCNIEISFKCNKYIAQIRGNTCNITCNMKYGIADIIRIADFQVNKHLSDSDKSCSIYNFKNDKYTINYETNKKWSYEFSNLNLQEAARFENSYYLVKYNQLCYSYLIRKIISLDNLCLFEINDYKDFIDLAEKILNELI